MARRYSPTRYQHKSTAFLWFLFGVMIIAALGALVYQFVIQFDFESFTSGEEPLGVFLPEDGYTMVSHPPQLDTDDGDGLLPSAVVTPRPTEIPIEKYALLNKRMLIPSNNVKVYGDLTQVRSSEPDDNRALVLRGWGYIEGLDARDSQIYIAVSPKYGDSHRIYLATRESGSTGLIHDKTTGTNLDQADFSINIRIEDTYQDGDYRLGVLVVNTKGKKKTSGYARLSPDYNFNVTRKRITQFEGKTP